MKPRIATLATVLAVCGWTAGCNRSETVALPITRAAATIEIDTATVQRGQLSEVLESVGTLLPIRAATIVSEVDGVIAELPDSPRVIRYEEDGQQKAEALSLDIGIEVAQGEVLVRLDTTDFELSLQQAQAQRNLIQQRRLDLVAWKRPEEIRKLQAALDEADAARQLALADLKRVQELRDGSAISQAEFDTAEAAAKRAAAAYEVASAALDEAQAGPTAEQLAVIDAELQAAEVEVQRRQRDLDKTVIRCPFPAVISKRFVGVGDRVTAMPRVEIMQIFDRRMLMAEIDVPERYQKQIQFDDAAEILVPGQADPLYGKVELIDGQIDPETRTFRVRIGIDNRVRRLKAGGFARVSVPILSRTKTLIVPRSSVTYADGKPAVYVVRADGTVSYRPIRLGIRSEDACEVLEGVQAGERIAIGNPALLSDGMAVSIRRVVPEADKVTRAESSREAMR
jgi:multidrug efflux pump subunit AcrA (membrane-fusion protein)